MAQRLGRLTKVLERVPKDHRRPGTGYMFDVGVANVRPGCVWLEPYSFAATTHEGLDEGAVPSSHIENRTRRDYRVETTGEGGARPAQDLVPEPREPSVRRAVPAAVRLGQL